MVLWEIKNDLGAGGSGMGKGQGSRTIGGGGEGFLTREGVEVGLDGPTWVSTSATVSD